MCRVSRKYENQPFFAFFLWQLRSMASSILSRHLTSSLRHSRGLSASGKRRETSIWLTIVDLSKWMNATTMSLSRTNTVMGGKSLQFTRKARHSGKYFNKALHEAVCSFNTVPVCIWVHRLHTFSVNLTLFLCVYGSTDSILSVLI
jgi:hypothetical protein